jgi:uncharacterized protein YegP (UPF0339 family)
MSQATHIEIIHTDAAQPFHFRIVAGNSEPIAAGENLTSKDSAFKTIQSIAALFGYYETFVVVPDGTSTGSLVSEPSGHVICPVRIIDERSRPDD